MENNIKNISFQGRLFAHLGHHVSKPIHCCKKGDRKFVKFINEIAAANPDSFTARITEGLGKNLEIETKEAPKLSFLEKIIYLVNPLQNKALKMRREGKIDYFTYRISETEYQEIKRLANKHKNINKKLIEEFRKFETAVRQKFSGEELTALEKIIY